MPNMHTAAEAGIEFEGEKRYPAYEWRQALRTWVSRVAEHWSEPSNFAVNDLWINDEQGRSVRIQFNLRSFAFPASREFLVVAWTNPVCRWEGTPCPGYVLRVPANDPEKLALGLLRFSWDIHIKGLVLPASAGIGRGEVVLPEGVVILKPNTRKELVIVTEFPRVQS